MLKEAIEKIVSLAAPVTFEIDGYTYASQRLERIEEPEDRPRPLEVSGLDSLCKLICTEIEKVGTTIMIRVVSHNHVEVFTTYLKDYSRYQLYSARADVPGFRTGYREREQALIELRSLFLQGSGTEYLLGLLSRMSEQSKVDTLDNGVTQTVETVQGVALKTSENIKPRVALAPFRTFLEVAQPESEFLLRVNENGDVGLFEADGGVWKLEAKQNICGYFQKRLADLIDAKRVIVMM